MSRGRSRRRRRMGVACVCECTRTRARLTQSEKCCMATVHKGTRLRIYACVECVCMRACACFVFLSQRQTLDRQRSYTSRLCSHKVACGAQEAHVQAAAVARRYCNSGNSHSRAQVVNTMNKIRQISRKTPPHARTHTHTLGGIRLSSRRTVDSPCGSKR